MEISKINNNQEFWIKLIFFIAALITLLVFIGHFSLVRFGVFSDGLGYYAPLRSLFFDGNLNVSDEYTFYSQSASHFGGGIRWTYPIPQYSKYTIGMGLILSPFFIIGHFIAVLLKTIGLNILTNGLTWPYELLYCLGSIFFGLAGLFICYKGARLRYGPWAASLAVIGIWFASPLTYYLSIESSMSHALSQFLISLFLYLCLFTSWENRISKQIYLGIVLGLAALVRPQNILFSVVPFLFLLFQKQSKDTAVKRIRSLFIVGIATLIVISIQTIVYQIQYGTVLTSPYLGEGKATGLGSSFDWLHPKIFSVLFSGFHGLFIWHPLLLIAVAGLLFCSLKFSKKDIILLIAFILQVYLTASWYCWYQGTCFGGRMFCNCVFIFVMGLAFLWSKCNTRLMKSIAITITAFFILWNFSLMLQLKSGMIPADKPVAFSMIAVNHFKVIPAFARHIFNR
ncbi:MAG: hypothetical protein P9M03_11860 [Candidatus Theseobacter exili]|nr:hypothetical protein [Candidatus Theseobacter exili]